MLARNESPSEPAQQPIAPFLQAAPPQLEAGDVGLETSHIPGGVPGVGPIQRCVRHQRVANGVVVEVEVELEFLAGEHLVAAQRLDLIIEPEEATFDTAHDPSLRPGGRRDGRPRPMMRARPGWRNW